MRGASRIALIVSFIVVVVAIALDRSDDVAVDGGAVLGLQVAVVLAAVVSAGIAYGAWAAAKPASTELLAAMISALVGGASVTSAVTTSQGDAIYAGWLMPVLGAVALAFAMDLLRREGRAVGR